MVIVTGANSDYFHGLENLVGSIHYWMPKTGVAIFNLGLDPQQLARIAAWRNCDLRWAADGPPEDLLVDGNWKHCAHMSQPKKYAWKPVALVEAVETYGAILWLDAGSDLRGPLEPVKQILQEDGYFLVKGQDLDMTEKLHRGCPRHLGLSRSDFAGKPSFAGNTQGYVKGSTVTNEVLAPMYTAACEKGCIAPFGSNPRNHRYDQSLLSLLAYSRDFKVKDHTEFLCSDRAELQQDPRLPSSKPIYTARCSSAEYIPYLRSA